MLSLQDFYLKKGNPVHHKSYCAFLDILGSTNRIRASYEKGTANDLLQEFHAILKKWVMKFDDVSHETPLFYKTFSDNLLFAHPQFSQDMEAEFGTILSVICEYQLEMTLSGFFIRGGLSIGELFMDENSVYGEALIDAYDLESKVAVNPIVVLSDSVMRLVNDHLRYYGDNAPQYGDILVNSDGRYFINYLSECREGEYLDTNKLMRHKKQIERSLLQYVEESAVFAKYSWLAAYHNHFCDSVSMYSEYTSELKVSGELMAVKFKMLEKPKR